MKRLQGLMAPTLGHMRKWFLDWLLSFFRNYVTNTLQDAIKDLAFESLELLGVGFCFVFVLVLFGLSMFSTILGATNFPEGISSLGGGLFAS